MACHFLIQCWYKLNQECHISPNHEGYNELVDIANISHLKYLASQSPHMLTHLLNQCLLEHTTSARSANLTIDFSFELTVDSHQSELEMLGLPTDILIYLLLSEAATTVTLLLITPFTKEHFLKLPNIGLTLIHKYIHFSTFPTITLFLAAHCLIRECNLISAIIATEF